MSASTSVPKNWRDRLPCPAAYYTRHVAKLGKPNGDGWAQGQCPFHEDRQASLSINLATARGFWKCFAGCGAGDLVSFHMRRLEHGFVEAVRDLLGLRK